MKKTLTMLFLLSATLPAVAQQMLIDKNGSNNEIVALENLKEITFRGTAVNVTQADGTTNSTEMSVINSISFGDYTAIDNINPDIHELVAYISSDEIAVNCKAGSQVTIYNVTGTQVLSTRLGADCGSISIANLTKGIYIIRANNRTAKIVRR